MPKINLTNKDYDRYRKLALVIAENDEYYADEILHTTIEKIIKAKKMPEITDDYIFRSLKNNYIQMMINENNRIRKEGELSLYNDLTVTSDSQLEELKIKDIEITEKLNLVSNMSEELNCFDQKLFYLHLVKGISQRQIARESGIGIITIHKRLKGIKDNIKNTYEEKRNNQDNGNKKD